MSSYYDKYVNAHYASDYKTPDWWRLYFGNGIDNTTDLDAFFASHPEEAADFDRITSGQKSQMATGGTSFLRTPSSAMSPEAAAYFADHPYEQLAYEGFRQDPTLSYMNYTYGPQSIGMKNPKDSKTQYLRDNRWTPEGIRTGNNIAMNGFKYGDGTFGGGVSGANTYNTKPQQMNANGTPFIGTNSYGGTSSYGGSSSGASADGGSASTTLSMNPYLQQMGDQMAATMTNNWQRQVQPQIASQAMATGGYGGSRQGVVEANSANDLNNGIGSALASLYGNGYNTGLQYDLGLRNNQLGYANLDRNIYNDNNNWQLQGANFGLGIYDRLQQGNQIGLNAGTNMQNTPMNYWSQFSNGANSIGQGYGTSTNSQNMPGSPLMGAIGGAQLGSQFANWWGGSPNAAGGANSSGWGTGSGYGNQDYGSYF